MTNYFKVKISINVLIVFIALFNITAVKAQEIDSLISKISNKDVYILLVKTMSPRIKGEEAKNIVKIGKPATSKLIDILEDQNKGIAAHFILSEIWEETWEEESCCNIKYVGNLEILTLNGLEICFVDNTIYATAESMRMNKLAWQKISKV